MSTRFTALTVNEGDAFLLEDNGWTCLFDSGVDRSIVDLLKFKGIDKLNLAICSHNDADHANGFIALFKANFQIDEIWLPGTWASVIEFIKKHCVDGKEVEWGDEEYNGELDSLFSDESVDEESINHSLELFNELKTSNKLRESTDPLHADLAHYMAESPGRIAHLTYRKLGCELRERFNEDSTVEQVETYLEGILKDYYRGIFPPKRIEYWAKRIANKWFHLSDNKIFYYELLPYTLIHQRQDIIKESLDIALDNIVEITTLASRHNCKIRWFKPSLACSNQKTDYGFVALNSSKVCSIRIPKSCIDYMCLMSLTKVNRYSLVFEYTKKGVPLIRFSADSDRTCQSVSPYPKNIIVTAPHHGSAGNAKVYKTIQGDDIVWVRSDERSPKRPCAEFRAQKNKYCLACERYNFVSEICFDYNPGLERWDYVRGEPCRCK